MNAVQQNSNFNRFTDGTIKYFKIIGLCLEPPETLRIKCSRFITVASIFLMLAHQIGYLLTPGRTFAELSAAVVQMNYTILSGAKILFLIYNRHLLLKSYDQLKAIYPNVELERQYKLEHHLLIYARLEMLLHIHFKFLLTIYLIYPIALSLYDLWSTGVYTYLMPLFYWYPVRLEESLLAYLFYYLLQSFSCFCVGTIILRADICLFSLVSQLLLHLELLAQRILKLQPAESDSLGALKVIIEYHQRIFMLANDVNAIFATSAIFSLTYSSFILCFNAYQLLGDVSFIYILRVLLMLCDEMKQTVITCYYGDKLMESSLNLFNVVYAHNWPDGSPAYKRLVLIMMIRTYRPICLNFAGIADVTLITLKQVISASYQIFAVLKTAQTT